jgi:hypothetical protein
MANPHPIVPHEAGKATRFRSGFDPRRSGKTSARFICDRLEKIGEDGSSPNEDILDHLIEVATKWEVIVVGHGDDAISVASAKDSVRAAEVLWSYALGKATAGGTVSPPANIDPNQGTLEIAMATYRERLLNGELNEAELAQVVATLMGAEKAEAEMIARILGDRKGGSRLLKERVESLLSKLEARLGLSDTPALPPAEPQVEPMSATEEDKPCP